MAIGPTEVVPLLHYKDFSVERRWLLGEEVADEAGYHLRSIAQGHVALAHKRFDVYAGQRLCQRAQGIAPNVTGLWRCFRNSSCVYGGARWRAEM
jgi:hypothetical protein